MTQQLGDLYDFGDLLPDLDGLPSHLALVKFMTLVPHCERRTIADARKDGVLIALSPPVITIRHRSDPEVRIDPTRRPELTWYVRAEWRTVKIDPQEIAPAHG